MLADLELIPYWNLPPLWGLNSNLHVVIIINDQINTKQELNACTTVQSNDQC